MDETPNLKLPYILAAQSQKHVTHNEAIRALDAVVQIGVLDRDLASPPPSPAEGARYLVAASPSGAWAGQEGNIAAFQDGAWMFYEPADGWMAWVADEQVLLVRSAGSWVAPLNPTSMLGINATADTTNRLALSSAASLFNHAGAGHQVKVNKATAGDTASFLFQTGFSGRAEMGTAGDDDFHFKVSADGVVWNEAMRIDGSARVAFGRAAPTCRFTVSDSVAFTLPAPPTGTFVHLAADAAGSGTARLLIDAFGGSAGLTVRRANGTAGAPSPLVANDQMTAINGFGYHSGGAYSTSRGNITIVAAENWTAAANGTYITFGTTALGSTTQTERMRIGPAGDVYFQGLSTTASAANAFIDSGSSPVNRLLRSTSSRRYKRDIEDLEPQRAERLLQARPIWYRSKCASDDPRWSWYGLLSEEMAEIDPRLVHWGYPEEAWEEVVVGEGPDAHVERRLKAGAEKVPDGVAYERLTVMLLSLVQRMWARVETLEARAGQAA